MFVKGLSLTTLVSLFCLMFIGGYVSASGVGLSCPKWPLCPAGFVPMNEFIIEYFHRSVAATTALLVFATMAFTLKSKMTPKGMKMASIIASGAAIGQITLGAVVIIERLHAVLVTVHLGLGLVLFAMVLLVVSYSYRLADSKNRQAKMSSSSLQSSAANS
ncbi:MAG TPA: COX15/CtaA family protein [Nitrososphaeraceae archaeon]|nr:COX15/CtaA family protein [Nitrososphaeraceae archaeon]